jgi:hypothetical protein
MNRGDEQNIALARSPDSVDQINAEFYGAFTFPSRPMKFDRALDPCFETDMLNQSVGGWSHDIFSRDLHVWVAGARTVSPPAR